MSEKRFSLNFLTYHRPRGALHTLLVDHPPGLILCPPDYPSSCMQIQDELSRQSMSSLSILAMVIGLLYTWFSIGSFFFDISLPYTCSMSLSNTTCPYLTQHVPAGSVQSSCRSQNVPGFPLAPSFLHRPYTHCPLQHWPFWVQATFSFKQCTHRNIWQYLPKWRISTII